MGGTSRNESIHKIKYTTFCLRVRALLGKKRGILNYEIEEAIEEVNRKAVGMVNLKTNGKRE